MLPRVWFVQAFDWDPGRYSPLLLWKFCFSKIFSVALWCLTSNKFKIWQRSQEKELSLAWLVSQALQDSERFYFTFSSQFYSLLCYTSTQQISKKGNWQKIREYSRNYYVMPDHAGLKSYADSFFSPVQFFCL